MASSPGSLAKIGTLGFGKQIESRRVDKLECTARWSMFPFYATADAVIS